MLSAMLLGSSSPNTPISAVPSSAAWVGATLILAIYLLLEMALSNPCILSHIAHRL